MQTTSVYLYDNLVEVYYSDNILTPNRGDNIVYQRMLKIYKGSDNPLKFQVRNRDQKKVDITDKDFVVDLIDTANKNKIASYSVTLEDATNGIFSCNITSATIDDIDQRFLHIVVRQFTTDGSTLVGDSSLSARPVYSDDNYDVLIPVELLQGYYGF